MQCLSNVDNSRPTSLDEVYVVLSNINHSTSFCCLVIMCGDMLQEAARAVRTRTSGALQAGEFLEEAGEDGGAPAATAATGADAAAVAAEQQYAAELARELGALQARRAGEDLEGNPGERNGDGAGAEAEARLGAEGPAEAVLGKRKAGAAEDAEDDEDAMAAVMMPRKARHLYASIQKRRGAKRARAAELERRAAALAQSGAD